MTKDEIDERVQSVARIALGYFPQTPEGLLHWAIIERAIRDLFIKGQKKTAKKFIETDLWPAKACGVSRSWLRKQINKAANKQFTPSELKIIISGEAGKKERRKQRRKRYSDKQAAK